MTFAEPNSTPALRALSACALAACTLLLQAGGGGGDSGTTVTDPPTISSASVDRLSYGRLSTFTVNGSNLAANVSFTATGCDGLTVLAGGSVSQQRLSCTPNKSLSVRLSATSAGGEIYSLTQPVPKPQVSLVTSIGPIVLELEPAAVPLTVDNFLAYVNAGFYNGTIFHRVVQDFVVQGGGFTGTAGGNLTLQTGLRAPIPLETNKGLSNVRGTIAMARTGVFDSATSQFYFNSVNNAGILDYANPAVPGYAVFGSIVSGLPVIDAMNAVATRTVGGYTDVPVTDIVLQSATQTK